MAEKFNGANYAPTDSADRPTAEHVVGDLYMKCLDLARRLEEAFIHIDQLSKSNMALEEMNSKNSQKAGIEAGIEVQIEGGTKVETKIG